MSCFTVDGVAYDLVHVAEVKRAFSILDGPNTGRAMTGEMRRDIIGTYYNYTLYLEPDSSAASRAQYDALYEVLSAPVASHLIKVPYGQDCLLYEAYVTSGEDQLILREYGRSRWGGTSVNFVAMAPKRVPA